LSTVGVARRPSNRKFCFFAHNRKDARRPTLNSQRHVLADSFARRVCRSLHVSRRCLLHHVTTLQSAEPGQKSPPYVRTPIFSKIQGT
jgi:hypothetical protein